MIRFFTVSSLAYYSLKICSKLYDTGYSCLLNIWDGLTDVVTITMQDNDGQNTIATHTLKLGGENFFTGIADIDYTIKSVTISTELQSIAAIADLQQVRLNPTPDPVPEPTTMLLIGTGLAGLAGTQMRRRKK